MKLKFFCTICSLDGEECDDKAGLVHPTGECGDWALLDKSQEKDLEFSMVCPNCNNEEFMVKIELTPKELRRRNAKILNLAKESKQRS